MNRMRLRTAFVSTVCAAAVGISGIGIANATAPQDARPTTAVDTGSATEQQLDELAGYLEAIFDGKIYDAEGKFDYDKTRAEYGADLADALADEFAGLNKSESKRVKRSYASCVLKGVGLGGILGSSTAIVNAIKGKHWKEAAKLITKEAAKRGIKIGVKGGVVGLASALGGYAVWCAMPWA
ncbi:hypothetical protein [Streptomyces sp. MNP-20]|uniref:hypothetical protein n=1 Tax=Streptomyces sp. MNP-20 TaxID=2721165 RepID=UPI0015527AA5|nr:hypothetical protein [Streptomyces sp. MNP-20]